MESKKQHLVNNVQVTMTQSVTLGGPFHSSESFFLSLQADGFVEVLDVGDSE